MSALISLCSLYPLLFSLSSHMSPTTTAGEVRNEKANPLLVARALPRATGRVSRAERGGDGASRVAPAVSFFFGFSFFFPCERPLFPVFFLFGFLIWFFLFSFGPFRFFFLFSFRIFFVINTYEYKLYICINTNFLYAYKNFVYKLCICVFLVFIHTYTKYTRVYKVCIHVYKVGIYTYTKFIYMLIQTLNIYIYIYI